MRRGSLSAGDGHAPPAAFAPLEDRAQPAHRARVLSPHPAPRAEPLHDPVRQRRRDGLQREPHPCGSGSGGCELVDAERANAVVLACADDLDDPVRAIDLDERDVGPTEAVARDLDAKTSTGAAAEEVNP